MYTKKQLAFKRLVLKISLVCLVILSSLGISLFVAKACGFTDINLYKTYPYIELSSDANKFNMTIDGEELDLWFDGEGIVYTDRSCTTPFISEATGKPYKFASLDNVIYLVDIIED